MNINVGFTQVVIKPNDLDYHAMLSFLNTFNKYEIDLYSDRNIFILGKTQYKHFQMFLKQLKRQRKKK